MPERLPIHRYTLQEMRTWLGRQRGYRNLQATFLHHTWSPDAQSYRGMASVEGIRQYHINNRGWSDIGANCYCAPDGAIYTARPLDYSRGYAHALIRRSWSDLPSELRDIVPYGATKWPNHYAFGVETIGDFDTEDPKTSRAMKTSLDVLALVHELWNIPTKRLFLHRHVADKSCPGDRVSASWARTQLANRLNPLKVVLLPGSNVVDCNPAIEGGTMRCDLRTITESLGYEVIWHSEQHKAYLRKVGGENDEA